MQQQLDGDVDWTSRQDLESWTGLQMLGHLVHSLNWSFFVLSSDIIH